MLAVPSRINVEQYQLMKSEIDEMVGKINGKFATINWTPVWYFYRSLPFEDLIELYSSCDIALLTPVRDGMNLVAKEFLATRTDGSGVLILSEMAGAFKEMDLALIINPNNKNEVAEAIKHALEMPTDEQKEMNSRLQERIKRYNVKRWASDFISSLETMPSIQQKYLSKKVTNSIESQIITGFQNASRKVLFLDYDGTLVNIEKNPQKATPDNELYELLDKLSGRNDTEIVLVTGRGKEVFDKWFSQKEYTLIAEHGVWIKTPVGDWSNTKFSSLNNEWKKLVYPLIEFYTDRTPASLVEEKSQSITWHYRNADPDLGVSRVMELKEELGGLIANLNLEILEGNKVLEVKNNAFSKGKAAKDFLIKNPADFVLAIGDDFTDESIYEEMPDFAYTIKVGIGNTLAKYNLESFIQARNLLKKLSNLKKTIGNVKTVEFY